MGMTNTRVIVTYEPYPDCKAWEWETAEGSFNPGRSFGQWDAAGLARVPYHQVLSAEFYSYNYETGEWEESGGLCFWG